MEGLRRLDVAFRFPIDPTQEAYCRHNYERSLFLTALVEGLVGALPARCMLRWILRGVGSSRDVFVPPNLAELRRRINPYETRSATNSGVEVFPDFQT